MNIPEVIEEFKGQLRGIPDAYVTIAILVLVALTSFGLGRLSVLNAAPESVRITVPQVTESDKRPAQVANTVRSSKSAAAASVGAESGEVVASKNGTKYHLPWCSGAKRISAVNKITFRSRQEAEKAGYSAAANCPGL
jgi:hypothetical protein